MIIIYVKIRSLLRTKLQKDLEFYKVILFNQVIQFYEATGSSEVRWNMWKISGSLTHFRSSDTDDV